ncbi:hypothetical protein N7451_003099 [Penicillium sp. IBT 35674x]|nr:hypothetical protein N7451_003099 [Penicillium sp. IBT 35674x]
MPLPRFSSENLPSYKDLPLDPTHPPHSCWGLWGEDDQLGCLNYLDEVCIREAAKEIQLGVSVGLSWGLNQMRFPPPFRMKLEHKITTLAPCINDDELHFNTQTSSQWDGFRHWSFEDGRLYNGTTLQEVRDTPSDRLGIHVWTKKGIVGRGVLLDYYSYAQEHGISYDPWSFHPIPVGVIQQIATEKGIVFEKGDILFLRTGFIFKYESMPDSEVECAMRNLKYQYPGLEGSEESLEWLFNNRFAAVAADCPGFEAWSATAAVGESSGDQYRMHETLLSGFGMPIGELFDLEGLAEECKRHGRWSFFVTSQPLNVVGGVGSPPNAIAIL